MKTALQVTKNETPQDRKAKELKKLTSEWILQRPKQNRRERHQTRTECESLYKKQKTALKIPRNRIAQHKKAKEQALAAKARK